MSLIDRVLLFLFSVTVAILSVLLIGQAIGYDLLAKMLVINTYPMLLGSIVLLLVAFRFVIYRESRVSKEQKAIVQKNDLGDVRISTDALVSLTERAAKMIRGVQDLKTKIREDETKGLRISIRMSVEPDVDIQKLSQTIQQKVKDYIEASTGFEVREVILHVRDLAVPDVSKTNRPRVQ